MMLTTENGASGREEEKKGKAMQGFQTAVQWMVTLILIILFIVVIAQIICRYTLGFSLFWSEELARYFLVWATFLGAYVAVCGKSMIGVTVFIERLPPTLRRGVKLISNLSIIGFLIVTIYYGTYLAANNFRQLSTALRIPLGVIYLVIPFSSLLMLIDIAFEMIRDLGKKQETLNIK